jgi:hypothetical protein
MPDKIAATAAIQVIGTEIPSHQILVRYMKLSTLMLLLDGKAFFPSVAKLQAGDRLEGALHMEPFWFFAMLKELQGDAKTSELEKWLEAKLDAEQKRNCQDSGTHAGYRLRLLSDEYIKQLASRRAVWCWVEGEAEGGESAAMWSIHANAGIAVQTTWSALESALPRTRRFCVGRIRYAEQDPSSQYALVPEDLDEEPWIFRPHFVKLRGYHHEHEIRIATRCHPEEKGVLVRNIDSRKLIEVITVSPALPYHEAAAIKLWLEKHFAKTHVRVRHSRLLGDLPQDEERVDWIKESVEAKLGGDRYESDLPSLIDDF